MRKSKLGKPSLLRGFKHSDETRKKLSESHIGLNTWTKGTKQSKEVIEKRSLSMKGKKQRKVTCPHCNKTGGTTMYRWHFDNCKEILCASKKVSN